MGSLDKTRKLALRPALAVVVTTVLSVVGLLNAAQPPAVITVEVLRASAAPLQGSHQPQGCAPLGHPPGPHGGPDQDGHEPGEMVNALEPDVTVIVPPVRFRASVLRTAVGSFRASCVHAWAPTGHRQSRVLHVRCQQLVCAADVPERPASPQ